MSKASPPPCRHDVHTMLGAIEMLKLGITPLLDDTFCAPSPTIEVIDPVMQAYIDSGRIEADPFSITASRL